MDKKQKLADLMPKVAQMVGEKRRLWGDAHVTDCVMRGMRGEPNQFYAFEDARVVGTPFDIALGFDPFTSGVAALKGGVFMVMCAPKAPTKGGADGQA